ncbi:MAG: PaaI family thioesterase [Burkholderiales bacterium]|nr:PaaI family thioesterase [Burkholderiales bacterium]
MEFRTEIPFVTLLGFELLRFERDEAEIALQLRDELNNSWGVAHGGVTMTLLDVAMAHAARSPGPDGEAERSGIVTIEMKTSFMRPGLGRIVATGKRLHRTASMAFCEASVVDAEGELIAHATGTFKFLRGLPAGGKRIQRSEASD